MTSTTGFNPEEWQAARDAETSAEAIRAAVATAQDTDNWQPVLALVAQYDDQNKLAHERVRWVHMRGHVMKQIRVAGAKHWDAIVEAAQNDVVARDAEYEAALDSNDARKAYELAKRTYRTIEREAFADGFYWTCGRCGGEGRWIGNGGTCFNCGGSGFHPTQTPHKFEASPKVRAKRAAAYQAKRDAEAAEFTTAVQAIGGRVAERITEVAAKGDKAMQDGEGYYDLDRDETFVYGLVLKLRKYGSLSAGQIAAIERGIARTDEREAATQALATVPPLATGKREIEGIIVSTKLSEDRGYGRTLKMLVKLDDGTKVYGSVPKAIEALTAGDWDDDGTYVEPKLADLTGARVAFTANVERSNDDPHFGFYSRPTKARQVTT